MKAIVWSKYGGPEGLELREVDNPEAKEDQVLIRIIATSVTAGLETHHFLRKAAIKAGEKVLDSTEKLALLLNLVKPSGLKDLIR